MLKETFLRLLRHSDMRYFLSIFLMQSFKITEHIFKRAKKKSTS